MTAIPQIMDTEIYENFFYVGFKSTKTGKTFGIEESEDEQGDREHLAYIMNKFTTIGFNNLRFDNPLIAAYIAGWSTKELKSLANAIISQDLRPWEIRDTFDLKIPQWDCIDLFDVAPGKDVGLKTYNGRLHGRRMQDLPYPHDATLTRRQRQVTKDYCINDLDATQLLYDSLKEQMDLRHAMSKQYGVDLRSKSDAQIAEAVITKEVERITGQRVQKPEDIQTKFRYRAPAYLKFKSDTLRNVLDVVKEQVYRLDNAGRVVLPDAVVELPIEFNGVTFQMGNGGLHSKEKQSIHFADDETMIVDQDVESYYPAIIRTLKLYPPHIGPVFLDVFGSIVDRRLAAKKAGDKIVAGSLKITVNGSFGKLGSHFSKLFAPDLLIQTTMTGQLALLLLIERLTLAGFRVISANTDGVVTRVPKTRYEEFKAIIAQWESDTGFKMEGTQYRILASRDVNTYMAITTDGKVKTKGSALAPPGHMKNPAYEILTEAITAFIADGVPVEKTIWSCQDIRKFVKIQKVGSGAEKDGAYLGKTVRWYMSTRTSTPIHIRRAKKDGTLFVVGKSHGAMPLMEYKGYECPEDLNRLWYIQAAYDLLKTIGFEVQEHPRTILLRYLMLGERHHGRDHSGKGSRGTAGREVGGRSRLAGPEGRVSRSRRSA